MEQWLLFCAKNRKRTPKSPQSVVSLIMPSNSKYHKNYTEFGVTYQLVLPLSLEGVVPNDDSVRLLSHELEDFDYSLLHQAYSAKGRNPAWILRLCSRL